MTFSSTSTGLRIGHLNVCSLPNKIPDLRVYFSQYSPHIFGISETKIKFEINEEENKITNETLQIPGYTLLRRDHSMPLHTGLAVYINDAITKYVKRRADLETGLVECLWLECLRVPRPE